MALYYVQRIKRSGVAFYSGCLSIIGWRSIFFGGGEGGVNFFLFHSIKVVVPTSSRKRIGITMEMILIQKEPDKPVMQIVVLNVFKITDV
jgi:hypothetical protein